jgi:hypothetical protein
MTDDERTTIYEFQAAQRLMPMAPDGFPEPNKFLDVMLRTLARKLLKVDMLLARRGELNAEERSVKILADATSQWLAAIEKGDRDPAIAEARFKALAETVEAS